MTSKIRIRSWNCKGLRIPDNIISFEKDENNVYDISLIQMPNGTGKTSTLELLRDVLSGEITQWERDKIRSYKKKNGPDSGFFEIKAKFDEKTYTFTAAFDFEEESVAIYTTVPTMGQKKGYSPPARFAPFIHKSVISYYMFDGELAQNLLDHKKTNAEDIINNMFGLNLFDRFSLKTNDYWESKCNAAGAKTDKGFNRRLNRVTQLESRIKTLTEEMNALLDDRATVLIEIESLERQYSNALTKNTDNKSKLEDIEKKLETAKQSVKTTSKELFEMIRFPLNLAPYLSARLNEFKNGLDRVKLPESAAREFFEEICQEKECICGRVLTEEIRAAIKERAQNYLGSDDMALLNSFKEKISESNNIDAKTRASTVKKLQDELQDYVSLQYKHSKNRDEIKLAIEQEDPEIQRISIQKKKLDDQLRALDAKLDKYQDTSVAHGDDSTMGIEVLKQRLADAQKKLDQIREVKTLNKKRDVLLKIISEAKRVSKNKIISRITKETNSKLETLLPENDIRLQTINKGLRLEGQTGGSIGEQLSIAYAFLATIFASADCNIPFIVDSPAGPIDLDVRPRIGELIPKLGVQVIAFTISSERAGFIPALTKSCDSEINFTTLCRKSFYESKEYSNNGDVRIISTDGVLIQGKNFFESFQDGDS